MLSSFESTHATGNKSRTGRHTTTNKAIVALAMASTIVCIWAASFIFIKLALQEIPPMTLALTRFAIATPILIAITSYQQSSRSAMKLALRKDFWSFSLLGLIGVTFLYVLQFYSLRFISATEGSIIINLHAIFAMLLSAAFLSEPLTPQKTLGVFVTFSGIIVITIKNTAGTIVNLIEPVGVLLMIAAALCWASYSVYGKKVLQRYSNQVTTSCAFLLGTIYLIPFAASEGSIGALASSSSLTWFSVIFLAIPSSVVTYVLWNRLIREFDVTKVLVSLYVIPIPTAILAYIILGETITYSVVLGAALIITGVYLTESSRSNRPA
jgi:drug/metabolite transporter (DMT)-like permease